MRPHAQIVVLCVSMTMRDPSSRRAFLALMGVGPIAAAAATGNRVPIGLELYSVRDELKKDLTGTVQGVAKMGYECVEFYAPYFDWTPDYAKQVRKELDRLKIRCYSTHNDMKSFTPEGLDKAIQLNKILGARYVVLASPGTITDLDGWKRVAQTLNTANKTFERRGLHAGYHNHTEEWKAVNGQTPMQVLADNTDKSIMLQLDVGHCVAAGGDPVAWIDSHPGRIRSVHLKDWSPEKQYQALFGEGIVNWKQIFTAAETKGGVEYYLIEYEGTEFPEMEAADRCLVAYRNMRA